MKSKFLTYFENGIRYLACYLTFFCVLSVCANAQNYVSQQRIKKVVIDAGHGGKDPGAVGKKGREKNITLSVALKLGELISKKFADVEVIYTRNRDVFVEVSKRGEIANRHNADLFISIHVDASDKTRARGASTWVMGQHKSQESLEVSRRENAVITMEDDYSTKYQGFDPEMPESSIIFKLLQNSHMKESLKFAEMVQNEMITQGPIKGDRSVRQAGFLVLWKTAMPRILIEIGFISNPEEEAILIKNENQAKIAQSIFSAFCKYKEQYEKGNSTDEIRQIDDTANQKAEEKNISKIDNSSNLITEKNEVETAVSGKADTSQKTYSVQIMAITKKIPVTAKDFKGHKNIRYMKVGNYYKYITGNFTDLTAAKRLCQSLQKDFKGAFVVAVEKNNLTLVR